MDWGGAGMAAVNFPQLRPEAPVGRPQPGYIYTYRQQEYRLVDPEGDRDLVAATAKLPLLLVKVLLGLDIGSDPQAHFTTPEGRNLNPVVSEDASPGSGPRIEGRENPLRVRKMERMFSAILAEEAAAGLPPKFGTPHRWSQEFLEEYRSRTANMPFARASKLLTALSAGVTYRYMATGQEEALIAYLLGREDGSVWPHEVFRKSYELNGGDVYLALLSVENVLAAYCRSARRENLAVTRKLAAITNNYGNGDKFGTWYHLFGIMLYGYAEGGLSARLVARVERLGSHVLSGWKDSTQKDWINTQGAVLGASLRKIVKEKKHLAFQGDAAQAQDPGVYLNLNEDFQDRLEAVAGVQDDGLSSRGRSVSR